MPNRDTDEPIIPGWDGELQGWADYCRRVRLCHDQTQRHKRYTLGPKLVLKLRGKAWEATVSLDYAQLKTRGGAQYLLRYLKDKLGRLPIPDIGQHLDDLFVRVRRQQGSDMVTWCTQLRESYRKVQRSLARTKGIPRSVGTQTEATAGTASTARGTGSEPHGEPPQDGEHPDSSPGWVPHMKKRESLPEYQSGMAVDGAVGANRIRINSHTGHRVMTKMRMKMMKVGMSWKTSCLRFCPKKCWVGC